MTTNNTQSQLGHKEFPADFLVIYGVESCGPRYKTIYMPDSKQWDNCKKDNIHNRTENRRKDSKISWCYIGNS